MAKRLTPEEKAQRLIEKIRRDEAKFQAKKAREKAREKEARHKRWLKSERARIRKKNEHFEEVRRQQNKNVLYERNLKEFVNLTLGLDVMPIQKDIAYPFYRFFFPYKMATPKGKLNPIEGFSTEVALRFIDTLIKAGHYYGHRYPDIYNIFCCHRVTGAEFIKAYNLGVNSYRLLFTGAPAELLYRLYNVRVPGSTARGAGEYLLCLKISDVVKGKNGDICTKSGVCIEAKAFDGRLDCQIPSNVKASDERLKTFTGFNDSTITGLGMIDAYNVLSKKNQLGDQQVIKILADAKIRTYEDFLTPSQIDLFIKNMTENWDGFFNDCGQFTQDSINRINGCHDAYVYPLLEKFTHLKVDTNQPASIKDAKDFDVRFRIFNKDDFGTPGLILRMIDQGYIKFYGLIKNDGRDKAVHVGI